MPHPLYSTDCPACDAEVQIPYTWSVFGAYRPANAGGPAESATLEVQAEPVRCACGAPVIITPAILAGITAQVEATSQERP